MSGYTSKSMGSNITLMSSVMAPYFSPAESVHVLSVTIFIYATLSSQTTSITPIANINSTLPTISILYTLDGSAPQRTSPNTFSVASGAGIFVDTIGDIHVRAIGISPNVSDSPESDKTYFILNRPAKPSIEPNGGTFAGRVSVVLGKALDRAKIFYTIDSTMPSTASSLSVDSGQSISLHATGATELKCIAYIVGMAPSSASEARFNIIAKVEPVVIVPEADTFTISATLQLSCSTPGAVIHYTLDGDASDMPNSNSLQVPNMGTVTVDTTGRHAIRAIAMEPTMLSSDVTTKEFTILDRLNEPKLSPPAGSYVGDLLVTFLCTDAPSEVDDDSKMDWHWSGGQVYYTLGSDTPTMTSSHTQCGESVLLQAPGKFIVRAFVYVEHMSSSAILQAEFTITRPSHESRPAFKRFDYSVQPSVVVSSVYYEQLNEGPLPGGSGSGRIAVRGRLVALDNPVGHIDLLRPSSMSSVSEGSRTWPSPVASSNDTAAGSPDTRTLSADGSVGSGALRTVSIAKAAASAASDADLRQWQDDMAALTIGRTPYCQIASSAALFSPTGAIYGNLVIRGAVVQTSDKHNVNFGVRNGSLVVGYFGADDVVSNGDEAFESLFGGAGWLVREGNVYIQESLSPDGDGEDVAVFGDDFATARTRRTAVGYDSMGRMLLLQVDGGESTTSADGITLFELADLAARLGFENAINIQPGALVQNASLISFPTSQCDAAHKTDFRCEDDVSTLLCIHAWPPQVDERSQSPPPPTANPTPSSPPPSPQPTFYQWHLSPSTYPTPSWLAPVNDDGPSLPPVAGNLTSSDSAVLQNQFSTYQSAVYLMGALLGVGLIAYLWSRVLGKPCGARFEQSSGISSHSNHTGPAVDIAVPKRIRMTATGGDSTRRGRGKPDGAAAWVDDTDRSIYHLSPSAAVSQTPRRNVSSNPRDWQAKLGTINLTVDSDSEEESESGSGAVEVVDFYRRDLPQMRTAVAASGGRDKQTPPPSKSLTASWSGSRRGSGNGSGNGSSITGVSESVSYAQVKDFSDDEEDGMNPFHRRATRL